MVSRAYRQTVTVWTGEGELDLYGRVTRPPPRQIKGRWEQRGDLFIDDSGKQVVSAAVVYVKEPFATGDYVLLGTSAATDPSALGDAFIVRAVSRTPSVDGRQEVIKLWL